MSKNGTAVGKSGHLNTPEFFPLTIPCLEHSFVLHSALSVVNGYSDNHISNK